ncbi:Protein THYLAKOID FORMATION 1 chloroplastic [Heracleum sosnowskyi]|uniref:Protein THYLAKOID FORMATION 1 chloroplastic n=1 Tax=Heracleum sosnowskyi TaxID=360622 RepID=A0AAD8N4G3_9APIA|nr:Protein THYLAKOID FORMATION 1 chloroplastic [Heracleum sosnowskyi]
MAAAITSLSFSALTSQSTSDRKLSSAPSLVSNFDASRLRLVHDSVAVRVSHSSNFSRFVVRCSSSSSSTDVPTVSETKANFLQAYKRPIPSIYNTVLQELIVQQHLTRYKRTHRYDAVFALGFVTVYDRLMEGYPSDEDREAIFRAYIKALREDPEQYRSDAQKLEEWLKELRVKKVSVTGRFFAIGLFRLLELADATEPTTLEKLCAALNIDKRSVDRDLAVYRNLLTKLVQAKELLKEYVEREKKKLEERTGPQTANEAVTNCLGEYLYLGL